MNFFPLDPNLYSNTTLETLNLEHLVQIEFVIFLQSNCRSRIRRQNSLCGKRFFQICENRSTLINMNLNRIAGLGMNDRQSDSYVVKLFGILFFKLMFLKKPKSACWMLPVGQLSLKGPIIKLSSKNGEQGNFHQSYGPFKSCQFA